jgi:hypothetical protein
MVPLSPSSIGTQALPGTPDCCHRARYSTRRIFLAVSASPPCAESEDTDGAALPRLLRAFAHDFDSQFPRSSRADRRDEAPFSAKAYRTPQLGRSPRFRLLRNNAAHNGRAGVAAGSSRGGRGPPSGTRLGGGRRQTSPGVHTRGVSVGKATPPGGLQLQSNRSDGGGRGADAPAREPPTTSDSLSGHLLD